MGIFHLGNKGEEASKPKGGHMECDIVGIVRLWRNLFKHHLPMWLEERIIQQCKEHPINSRRSDELSRVVGQILWRGRDKRSVKLDGQDIFLSSYIYKMNICQRYHLINE